MRIVLGVLIVSGCAQEPYVLEGGAQAAWNGETLTISASYFESNGTDVREYLPEMVTATIRGEQRALTLASNDDPQILFPKHYYAAAVQLASAPDGEDIVVDVAGQDGARAAITMPTGFDMLHVPASPTTLPVTLAWMPAATDKMLWWLTGACIDESLQPHSVLRGDDVTLVDEGKLTIEPFYIDAAMPCEVTLEIERYREVSRSDGNQGGRAAQHRSVTFVAQP